MAVANADQADADNDGTGDLCETSNSDGDSILDYLDNCPSVANESQVDTDGDGLLSQEEMTARMQQQAEANADRRARMFDRFDADDDGAVNVPVDALLGWDAAWRLDSGFPAQEPCATAFAEAAEQAMFVAPNAVQILGGQRRVPVQFGDVLLHGLVGVVVQQARQPADSAPGLDALVHRLVVEPRAFAVEQPHHVVGMPAAVADPAPQEPAQAVDLEGRLGRVLGRPGGFGITYLALHRKLKSLGVVTGTKSGARVAYVASGEGEAG